jgi:hypothetical protein
MRKIKSVFSLIMISVFFGFAQPEIGNTCTADNNLLKMADERTGSYKTLHFSFQVYDAITIRKNPTTQVGITIDRWTGDTFVLWLPEAVGDLWQQWDADVAHQDFTVTKSGGLLWTYEGNPAGFIRTELIPQRNSLLLETQVTNLSNQELVKLYAQNCIHFSKAPEFICDDFSRIYLRIKKKWYSLASLKPTTTFPRYYREGYPERGRIDPLEHNFGDIRQDSTVDYPLMVLVSKDGTRTVGIASEDFEFLFHNQMPYLRCIHSESGSPPPVPPGKTAIFRQKVYFVEGGLMDCVAVFEKDIVGNPSESFSFKK